MQGEQAYAKFKAPIETGLQTKAPLLYLSIDAPRLEEMVMPDFEILRLTPDFEILRLADDF